MASMYPFDKFNAAYIKERDAIFAKADLNFDEPHFNVRISTTLNSLGYNYDVSSPIGLAATNEFCEEFMKYVRIDADTEETA